jgi:dTMP kinase
MALFITFEGGEGSGKSTQARLLADRLRTAGLDMTEIHEPGSTRLGWQIRDWLKRGLITGETMSHNAELFLFAAARSQLVAKVLRPALDRPDAVVISDRYADSTIAYQGYGRGISLNDVKAVNALATRGIE